MQSIERREKETSEIKFRESADRVKRGQCEVNAHLHVIFDDVVLNPLKPVLEVADGDNKRRTLNKGSSLNYIWLWREFRSF